MQTESLLILTLHFSTVLDDEAKAALRDLDLEVDLKQLWTGSNRQVTN